MAKALIVDDVVPIRKALHKVLTDLGHEVVAEATNGQEGYNAFCLHNPDFVTMDISMPVMDGIDAVEMICKKDANAKIIMISSQGAKEQVIKAIKNGAKGYILKPINRQNTKEALDKIGVS